MQIRAILCVLGGALFANTALAQHIAGQAAVPMSQDASADSPHLSHDASQLDFLLEEFETNFGSSNTAAIIEPAQVQISMRHLPDTDAHGVGLRLRLAEMDQRKNGARPGWYLFMGTDNEALTWSQGEGQDVELRDHTTVGDMHIGLSFPTIGGQASFGYARRSVSYSSRLLSAEVEQDMLGLSYGYDF